MKKITLYLLLIISITLAIVVAYVSIKGLLTIFSGSGVIGLLFFSILEVSKVIATSAIHTYGKQIGRLYTVILSLGVLITMCITSIGVYGFLSSGYEKTSSKSQNVDKKILLVSSKIDNNTKNKNLIEKQLTNVRGNITQLRLALGNNTQSRVDRNGNIITTSSNLNRKSFEKQLDIATNDESLLNKKLDIINNDIDSLNEVKIDIEINQNQSTELGPLKYLAKVFNTDMDSIMKWFILLLIIIGDPMAIIMIIIFNKIINSNEKNKEETLNNINDVNTVINDNPNVFENEEILHTNGTTKGDVFTEDKIINEDVLTEENVEINNENTLESKIKLSDLPEVKKRNFSVNIPERRGNNIEHVGSNKELRNGENKLWYKKR